MPTWQIEIIAVFQTVLSCFLGKENVTMKIFKRVASFVLLLCMMVTFLPPMQVAKAADVVHRYELDTDGIDVGATYLIVNSSSVATCNALKFSTSGFQNQQIVVQSDENGTKYIDGFTGEENCQFQFSASGSGRISHDNYYMDLDQSRFTTSSPSQTLTFTNLGNGQYRIHYSYWFWAYYLRYNNNEWERSSSSSAVYLYKLTEHVVGYDVNYNGNGHTSGTLPENAEMLSYGEEYTLLTPTELRKDVGEDTWFFQCWNTAPDGSGTEYLPGDKITVTKDTTLYVEWYQQTKHTISMITYLDGERTDVNKFAGYDRQFFAKLEGGDGTYIPLNRTEEGTYSAKVPDNGTYVIYAITKEGEYSPVHGHKIIVYNDAGSTECLHYSITYDTAGGTWAEGQAPTENKCHNGETVIAPSAPVREGYRFLGWKAQDNKTYEPGHPVTENADRTITLTAVWEELIDVTVTLVIDHKAASGGVDGQTNRHDATLYLLREENGVNLPVEERVLTSGYVYDEDNDTTTYTVVFQDLPQGVYTASSIQQHYVDTVSRSGNANEDQTVRIDSKYTPEERDMVFNVVVNMDNEAEKALKPVAVNLKVSFWGHKDGVLGWHITTRQEGDNLPSTVMIDENGFGTANFTMWPKRSGTGLPYEFRVEVTSFVMPDHTIVPASGDLVTYRANGSGLYEATVSVEGDGRVPTYPEGSDTTLEGAYFVEDVQMGIPTVTVEINPMTVTFDAGDGLVNGQQTVVLENQYRYPALHDYVAVSNNQDKVFVGWTDAQGNLVDNMENQLLAGDVTYYARYKENITLSGTVAADAVYEQDGKTVEIPETDRVETVMVVLQKRVGDVYNDIDSRFVTLTYTKNVDGKYYVGVGNYAFKDLPNDGTQYRVQVLAHNYDEKYDNNQDRIFNADESVAQVDELKATGRVDVHLDFAPEAYQQAVRVDASQIQAGLRPTGALAQILYRDLGDSHSFQAISQHTVDPFGIKVDLNSQDATGMGYEDVWNFHTNGTPYEYQAHLYKLYGNDVAGAYTREGTEITDASPFTVVYGAPTNYMEQDTAEGVALQATLVPKQYLVEFDLNLGDDKLTPVYGLEDYMVDDGTGRERYAYVHTWSYAGDFVVHPYREGYVFTGWQPLEDNEVYIKDDGTVHVGATLDHKVTLTATWQPLQGTDYIIRYMELNTDKVLQGATVVTGADQGEVIMAAENAPLINGYVYVGAAVGGAYIDKAGNPSLTVSNNPAENLLVIYYLPDGSDGYTEQVESNLEINKHAVLENNGTYTITLDTYTKDNPITTLIQQNTPLDIVLVLDQSGSLSANNYEYLNALQGAVNNFVESVADHGRHNEVDHRIAIVGYASDVDDGHSNEPIIATGGKESDSWVNTGVFDSNGEYHLYNVNGFNYTELKDLSEMKADGVYYTKVTEDGKDHYLLLRHHDEYRHLITEEQARVAQLQGEQIYGYVYDENNKGDFEPLTRNSSGLWLYGDKKLYSADEFFTYHTDVWTHRHGVEPREIHAYGVGAAYTPIDGHTGVYTREETTSSTYQQSIYQDALIPVSVGANGSGGTNPGLLLATQSLGADGATRAGLGMEMANDVLAAHPLSEGEERVRLVVMFTDGDPGFSGFGSGSDSEAVNEANKAIQQAYISKNTYGAYVYAIGLYESAGVSATSNIAYYMNALSSNYPNAQSMNDIKRTVTYVAAADGTPLEANGKFFVRHNNSYYEVKYGNVRISGNRYQTCWYYTRNNTNYSISTAANPTVTNGKVGTFSIYQKTSGYAETEYSGYYATTESSTYLKEYFEDVLRDITTKITTEIILESDTILRDIMNQGLVLTDGTVITVYTQEGNYDLENDKVVWAVDANGDPVLEEKVNLKLGSGLTTASDPESGVAIYTYNLNAQNATNPNKPDYHPHTVDITGYNFSEWYISETHTKGYKMVVTITQLEATDDVEWSRSTFTNNEESGLWLPADEDGNRQLLQPFQQPTTVFVERAYVLDYGKEFTLVDWYFDSEDGKVATPIHVDCDISNGMNWFDPSKPNTSNAIGGEYGNTKYGNVQIKDGKVTYAPTSMNWGGFDQFYVFGNTWRRTVLAQDANTNGNLWNKVTVIPANNIYYEDSFVTTEDSTWNGIEGFTFGDGWERVFSGSESDADKNTEVPEHKESPYHDIHGWTDSLADDGKYTDGSAHMAGLDKKGGAKAEFTFTGTGVEVYTSTNQKSGIVLAILKKAGETKAFRSLAMDNLAMSGGEEGYYHIPTVSFKDLPYGTYTLQLIAATASAGATGQKRHEYCIDGVRIHNPLGNTTNYQTNVVKQAYGLETNAVFTEVRDILLNYGDFNTDISDSTDGKMGAVFIDWIRDDQGSGEDVPGIKNHTYELGTYEALGPKNEVYLTSGQAIVLKVSEENYYYVGLKSLTGAAVTVNVSGVKQDQPQAIEIKHTTDLYYRVTPVNGYIVIQNANTDDAVLSVTNLRTTNLKAPTASTGNGVLSVTQEEAVAMISDFSEYMEYKRNEESANQPDEPEEKVPTAQELAQADEQLAVTLFTSVRQWLDTE